MKPKRDWFFFASTARVSDLPPPIRHRYRILGPPPYATYKVKPNDHKPRRPKLDWLSP